MKSIGLALLAFVLALPPLGAQEKAPLISLQQSIDAALANGDDNKVLQGGLDVARAQHALNVSKNSFSLSGSAGYQQDWLAGNSTLKDSKVLGSTVLSTAAQAGLSLAGPLTTVSVTPTYIPADPPSDALTLVAVNISQTIWNGYWGGPLKAAVDKSSLTLQGKELATESGRLGIVYTVKQAYYTMLAAQRNHELKKQILDKQNGVLAQIQAVYDLKLASLADLKTAQVNARSAQVDVDSATHDLRFARIALATLMGMAPDASFTVAETEDPAVPVTTEEAAVAMGLSRRADLKQVELSIRSSNVDLALARGQATPTVSVSGGVDVLLDWGSPVSQANSANVGVKVSMPVLDAGATRNLESSILRQNQVYALQETQLRKSITTAIQAAWDNVLLARAKVEVAQMSVEATNLQYQLTSVQRDSGTASNQDLLTAAVNLANAQNALAGAQSGAQLAVLQLQNVMGY